MSTLVSVLSEVIQRRNVSSVSCPLDEREIWRLLIAEQQRREAITGLPLQHTLGLSGPDSGLEGIPIEEWGGKVRTPHEGVCEADLFIQPKWDNFFTDAIQNGGKLRRAVRRRGTIFWLSKIMAILVALQKRTLMAGCCMNLLECKSRSIFSGRMIEPRQFQ